MHVGKEPRRKLLDRISTESREKASLVVVVKETIHGTNLLKTDMEVIHGNQALEHVLPNRDHAIKLEVSPSTTNRTNSLLCTVMTCNC